jgi:hypothetical protein
MAMNPMQRRARNSFLIGFLVALIIMALIVFFLLTRIQKLNEEKEALLNKQSSVYVATEDLESGEIVTLEDNFTIETVQTTVDSSEVISSDDFELTDDQGNTIFNDDGSAKTKEVMMKINVPAGTIVTKDMIADSDDKTTDTQRILEFNSILLPSQLKNGDYVDIRFTLHTGQDYIVLSKKRVLGTTATTIWLKLDEEELLTLNNAIVESYTITGSKIYAATYVEPGIQEASTPTYVASAAVVGLINSNPNITVEAKNTLADRYYGLSEVRTSHIASALSASVEDEKEQGQKVDNELSNEIEAIKSARQEFVESLEGTDDIGYSR